MSEEVVAIGFRENQTSFRPGEMIEGAVRWELKEAPRSAEIRLCWRTRGKGTNDSEVVHTLPLDAPSAGDVRTFAFTAPESPYSFSGKLISLIWSVELLLKPGNRREEHEVTIGPDAKEVVLPTGL
jgi:hypothetical protein